MAKKEHNPNKNEAVGIELDEQLENNKILENSLTEFWEKFQLSPKYFENAILTNMGWLTLITLGPLGLLVILWTLYVAAYYKSIGQDFVARYAFFDLKDPIFTFISLSLFFGAVIFRYRWYPSISNAFQSLAHNEVLFDKEGNQVTEADYVDFLRNYRKNLHSHKRYLLPSIFIILLIGASIYIMISRGFFGLSDTTLTAQNLLAFLHVIPRWIIAPLLWSYIGMLFLWTIIVTTKTVMDLTPRFQINIQPLHYDRAGGLKKLGDLCSHIGLLVVVAVTPSIVLSIQGIVRSTKIVPCGNQIQQFTADNITMTQQQLTDCIYYQNSRFTDLTYSDISDYIINQLADGNTLQNLATDYYERHQTDFQRDEVIANYSIYYIMVVIVLVVLALALYVVIRSLFDIHESMVKFIQKKEQEINQHLGELYGEFTSLIKSKQYEEADKLKGNINFLSNELNEIQKYPRWPISSMPVLRSYLTSSFLTAFLTYVFSLLNLQLSTETSGVISELIKSVFGQ